MISGKSLSRRIIRQETGIKPKGSHKTSEHDMQVRCMTWLKYAWPDLDKVTFAVPNGGVRDKATAAQMKAEGEKAGVADIIVLKANVDYTALCIEMKTKSGRQSPDQKRWQKAIEDIGECKYVICRSMDDFVREITEYMSKK